METRDEFGPRIHVPAYSLASTQRREVRTPKRLVGGEKHEWWVPRWNKKCALAGLPLGWPWARTRSQRYTFRCKGLHAVSFLVLRSPPAVLAPPLMPALS